MFRGKERCVGSGEVWGGVWESVWVSGEVCWRVGRGVGKCVRVWSPVRKDVWGVKKRGEGCGRVYGVSGEV